MSLQLRRTISSCVSWGKKVKFLTISHQRKVGYSSRILTMKGVLKLLALLSLINLWHFLGLVQPLCFQLLEIYPTYCIRSVSWTNCYAHSGLALYWNICFCGLPLLCLIRSLNHSILLSKGFLSTIGFYSGVSEQFCHTSTAPGQITPGKLSSL